MPRTLCVVVAFLLAACGGGVGNPTSASPGNSHTVGGTVSGLSGTVVLQNNHGDNLSVSSNSAFTFANPVVNGRAYSVAVLTHPSGQICSIANGTGTIAGAAVTNVAVSCASNATPTVSVTISPAVTTVAPGGTRAFTATVSGTINTAVTWSVTESSGCGSITQAGVYSAPASAATCHVVATSLADSQKFAAASVAVIPPPTGSVPVGVNIAAPSDWERQQMFADVIKHGRPWGSVGAAYDESATVDANGWPTGDAGIVLQVALPGLDGTYRLSFVGNATVTAPAQDPYGSVAIQNKVYDAVNNRTTADVVISPGAGNLWLAFQGQAGGVKDVKLIRPGHTASDVFYKPFLDRIQPFSLLRFMDFTQTNNNPTINWSDRTTPGYSVQTQTRGAAWEYVVQLANVSGKDVWISIPYNANDDYITRLAQLFKYGSDGVNPYTSPQANPVYPPLDPGRRLYFEHGNELWNYSFHFTQQALTDTQAELAAGDPHHFRYTACNDYECAARRVGWLGVRASLIFRSVFGDADMMTRVRPVLASQLTYYAMFNLPLGYVEDVHGSGNTYGNPGHPVAYYFYAISGAPYVDTLESDHGNNGLSVDQIFVSMRSYMQGTIYAAIDHCQTTATARGLKCIAYEGGQHLLPVQGSGASKLAAQTDPRMGTLLVDLLHKWYSVSSEPFVYYTLCGGYGNYGYWGLSTDIHDDTTVKWQAVKQVVGGQ